MSTRTLSTRRLSPLRYNSTRTLVMGAPRDPYFNYTTLLLQGDGTNGGQNNTFLDSSTNNFTITRNGNTTQGSFSPYGTLWSNFFDGNRDYLSVASSTDFAFGTDDFTMECWVNGGPQTDPYSRLLWIGPTYNVGSIGLVFDDADFNNKITFVARSVLDGRILTSSTSVTDNRWYHVAVTRASGTFRLFINGVLEGTNISYPTGNVGTLTQPLTIGSVASEISGEDFAGYVSNVRIIKGTALYTADFTPSTTPLSAVTNTKLLTCQSNRFIDNSTNNFAITRNGDVAVTNFAPFAPTSVYTTGQGASGYFDGSGDSVVTPSSSSLSFGTGDFSVEAWIYFIAGNYIISNYTQLASPGDYGTLIYWNSGSVRAALKSDNANELILTSSVVAAARAWNHVAFVRTGTTVSLYLNGSRVATGTSSITSLTDKFKIGGVYVSNSSGDYTGYVTDLRVYKGAGPYDATSSSITVPTAPLTTSSNPSLLMNFTNAAIFDSAAKNDLETVGNAQIDTTTKKFGTGSLEFDGTGDWLLLPDNPDLQLGTGNLTVEFWVYLATGDAGSNRGLVSKGTASTGWSVSLNTTQKVVFSYASSTITSSGAITLDAWNHIAVVREGTGSNQTKIYINGTNDGTGTVSTDFNQTNVMYIGANRAAGDPMKGYIDDLRITKGVARYTANFTPPSTEFPKQ